MSVVRLTAFAKWRHSAARHSSGWSLAGHVNKLITDGQTARWTYELIVFNAFVAIVLAYYKI